MASRRLFSKDITQSDLFLNMPLSSQALYFHLGLSADDDGFVSNPRTILRMVGASDDDFSILIMKKFVITFETGVIVITHWLLHNSIRKDRYHPTIHVKEKAMLTVDNNIYIVKDICSGNIYGSPVAVIDEKQQYIAEADRLTQFKNEFKEAIDYDSLIYENENNKSIVDEIVELTVDIVASETDGIIAVGSKQYPASYAINRLKKMDYHKANFLIMKHEEIGKNKEVKNPKRYMQAIIFNTAIDYNTEFQEFFNRTYYHEEGY